ncbi:HAD hydrolase-like protein [Holdemanella sp. L34]|uniref:HAD hydrolase-like protein n=1 Tax=Holdemanella hominis TaxID=2764327 RepID=A0ABR7KGC7_9FIRM|nr:HAD hydrolase-like protein [Holdemanella hominis]
MWSKELELDYRMILNPHVLYVLPKLKAKGYKLTIASSSSMENIKKVTRQCGIASYFGCV